MAAEVQIEFWRRELHKGIKQHLVGNFDAVTNTYCVEEARLQGMLAVLPAVSFLAQLYFSLLDGTSDIMRHHFAVMYTDWLLIPFNYFAARVIDWRRGITLYIISVVSTVAVLTTHALWQIQGVDLGHMIRRSGVVLAAGWVHAGFSIAEMTIFVAFAFCRHKNAPILRAAVFGYSYFLALAIGGICMHGRLILSDAYVLAAGGISMALPPIWRWGKKNKGKRLHLN